MCPEPRPGARQCLPRVRAIRNKDRETAMSCFPPAASRRSVIYWRKQASVQSDRSRRYGRRDYQRRQDLARSEKSCRNQGLPGRGLFKRDRQAFTSRGRPCGRRHIVAEQFRVGSHLVGVSGLCGGSKLGRGISRGGGDLLEPGRVGPDFRQGPGIPAVLGALREKRWDHRGRFDDRLGGNLQRFDIAFAAKTARM